jgi:hypothetical protein
MIVAREIVRGLQVVLDTVLAHKLRTISRLELAPGSVSDRSER